MMTHFIRSTWLFLLLAPSLCAEEVWLHDNTRLYGQVGSVSLDGRIGVVMPDGQEKSVALEEIVAIRFLGREPLLIQNGTQEMRFLDGGRLRGQIIANQGDRLRLQTALAGELDVDLGQLRGFVSLPLVGFSGRKAEELVEGETGRNPASLDQVLDRRGSVYPGALRKLTRTELFLDHEDLLQVVPIKVPYIAGVRLADASRSSRPRIAGTVQVRLTGRDESAIQGSLVKIHLGKWHLKPSWDEQALLIIDVSEIARVQVIGGRVQYLSQLEPVKVTEKTILAPPQPFRMDASCQGDVLKIGPKRYPWGIGVHADSELTFAIEGRFREFRADVGLAASENGRGSVFFVLLGDDKEIYRSKQVTASDRDPIEVVVPVKDVKRLTLKVLHGDQLDLGDAANWCAARVVR